MARNLYWMALLAGILAAGNLCWAIEVEIDGKKLKTTVTVYDDGTVVQSGTTDKEVEVEGEGRKKLKLKAKARELLLVDPSGQEVTLDPKSRKFRKRSKVLEQIERESKGTADQKEPGASGDGQAGKADDEAAKKAEADEKARLKQEADDAKKAEAEEQARLKQQVEDAKKAETEEKARLKQEADDAKKTEAEEQAKLKQQAEDAKKVEAEENAKLKQAEKDAKKAEKEEKARLAKEAKDAKRAEREEKARLAKEAEKAGHLQEKETELKENAALAEAALKEETGQIKATGEDKRPKGVDSAQQTEAGDSDSAKEIKKKPKNPIEKLHALMGKKQPKPKMDIKKISIDGEVKKSVPSGRPLMALVEVYSSENIDGPFTVHLELKMKKNSQKFIEGIEALHKGQNVFKWDLTGSPEPGSYTLSVEILNDALKLKDKSAASFKVSGEKKA